MACGSGGADNVEGDELLTVDEALRELKVGRTTLYRWVKEGRLERIPANPAKRSTRQGSLFRRSDIDKLKSGAQA